MILDRLKLYALIILGVILGMVGLRFHWSRVAELEMEAKLARKQNERLAEGREVENEIRSMDDDALRDAASRWVRGSGRE